MTVEQAARAQTAINQIDFQVASGKKNKATFAYVFRVPREDYQPPFCADRDTPFDIDWLKGAARFVYQICEERGFKPTIEAVGWTAEMNIAVHWS